jgi:hypothetical protein
MRICASCGEPAGEGRFCVRCGQPTPAPAPGGSHRLTAPGTDTAERPAVSVPPPPPPPFEPAFNARFPLYADEVGVEPDAPECDDAPAFWEGDTGPDEEPPPRRRASWPWWVAVAVVLVIAALVGGWLALRAADSTDADAPGSSSARPSGSTSAGPGDGTAAPAGRQRNLTIGATALVPAVAPPNQDLRGRVVRYDPGNLFDGRPATAWRMVGDGTGELLTIRLPRQGVVTEVGIINGYAKIVDDGATDWYRRNRRLTVVTWSFDDGSVVTQRLSMRPELQTVPVDEERTRTIRLRLVRVSPPLPGRRGRNYTAISEIVLRGHP